MARPARFSDDDILDGAALAVRDHGPTATVADVARAAGCPTGSIYHRFAGRDDVMTRLWLRSVGRFHRELLACYRTPSANQAVDAAARHVAQFSRQHPSDAFAMTLYRQSTLVETAPEPLRDAVRTVNDEIDEALTDLVKRRYGQWTAERHELLMVATRLAPYGVVRPFVGGELPAWSEEVVAASAAAIAALGD